MQIQENWLILLMILLLLLLLFGALPGPLSVHGQSVTVQVLGKIPLKVSVQLFLSRRTKKSGTWQNTSRF